MPFLHCITTKCSIPPTDKFPWFFSSALPGSTSTVSRRSISGVSSAPTITKRFYYTSSSGDATTYIVIAVVIAVISLFLSLCRYLYIRKAREHRANKRKEVCAPRPLPAFAYAPNYGMPPVSSPTQLKAQDNNPQELPANEMGQQTQQPNPSQWPQEQFVPATSHQLSSV